MKILLLSQFYKPEMGAPQSRLYEMLIGLQKEGAEVAVVTAMPNYPAGKIFPKYRGKFSYSEQLDNILLKRFWLYASNSRKKLPRIISMLSFSFTALFSWRFCKKFKPDIIIVESPPLTLAFTGWLLAKKCKSLFISNISDLWPLSALELEALSKGKIYNFLERCEGFIFDHSDAILGQSQEIVEYIKERTKSNIYFFRNGVDFSRFNKVTAKRASSNNEQKKIVYAGLLGVAQGILTICKSINFKELGVQFYIYGAGAEKEEIEAYLAKNPNKGICYKGVLKREEVPAVLMKSDGALIPLTKMIFGAVPSKIYEAMAAELPILFSGEGEGATIIRENNVGWTNKPSDMEGLYENIIKFSTTDLSAYKSRCKEAALTKFNRPLQIKALFVFFQSLIQSKNDHN